MSICDDSLGCVVLSDKKGSYERSRRKIKAEIKLYQKTKAIDFQIDVKLQAKFKVNKDTGYLTSFSIRSIIALPMTAIDGRGPP